MPRTTEADRLEAFMHAFAGNLRLNGVPVPNLDLSTIRREPDPDVIASAAAFVARTAAEWLRPATRR